jgi:protein TonB
MPTAPSSETKGGAPRPRARNGLRHAWAWLLVPIVALCILGAYILGQQAGKPVAGSQTAAPASTPATPPPPPTGKVLITEIAPPPATPATPEQPKPAARPAPKPTEKAPARVEPPVVLPKEAAPAADAGSAGTDASADSGTGAGPVEEAEEPVLLNNPPLTYPTAAYEARAQGTARVAYAINEKGEVEDVRLVASSGDERLDRAALDYVTLLRFKPATRNGVPVRFTQERNVKFNLP